MQASTSSWTRSPVLPDPPVTDRPVVLVAIKGLGIGGAEKLISEAVSFWDRARFDYRVAYFLPWKDQLVEEISVHGVEVDLVGGARGLDARAAWRLRRLIRKSGAAIVHVHSPAVAVLARVVSPAPIVYTEHNVVDSYREPTRTLNRLTYHRNAAVIAVSDAVAASVEAFRGPSPRVIRNGVSCQVTAAEATAVRQELGLSPDDPLVVHVGNIRPYKGHRNLIGAVSAIRDAVDDVTIVSIGVEKNPGDLAAIEAEAESQGVADSIRFLGRRSDARAFLAAADIVVNPSDVEGLPIVVLEAMSLARPIVATAVGGVPSVIIDEQTGLLVPPGDSTSLADRVIRLLEDRGLGASLGRAASELAERDFSLAAMVREVEDVYGEVLNG